MATPYETALSAYGAAAPTDEMSVTRSSPYIEGIQASLAPQLAQSLGNPINAMGGTNQYGQAYGSLMPQAQGQNALQQSAIQSGLTQAGLGTAQFGPGGGFAGLTPGTGTGIAGYQQFLDNSARDFDSASTAADAGQGAGSQYMGPGAQAQFQTPYQQDVIDTSLAQFDQNAAQQAAQSGLTATQAGAFGGARFGVQEGQRQAQSNLDRASLTANLLQQNFSQAQNQANTAFGQAGQQAAQNVGLYAQTGQGQSGLASLQPQLAGQTMATLGTLGSQQQQQSQAALDTAAQGNSMVAYQPQQGMGFVGDQLANMMQGYGGGSEFTSLPAQTPASPMSMLMNGMGAGASLGSMFGGWGG